MFNSKMLYLERIGIAEECKIIEFKKVLNTVGRRITNDIHFGTKAITVSREQSLIEFKNGRMYISNLSKTNATYINGDQVIRTTEVEEGDLIGFGSNPNSVYPGFEHDQIFIYKCKSKNQPKIIVLDDSDDDIVQVVDVPMNESIQQQQKSEEKAQKNESETNNNTNKFTSQVPTEQVTSYHFDTIEKINDISESDSSYSEDDNYPKHVLKPFNISVKKLTDEEIKKWRPKQASSDEDDDDDDNVDNNNFKQDEKEIIQNERKISRVKSDTLSKTKEMWEKIRRVVDPDSDDDLVTIPITQSTNNNNNNTESAQKNSNKRRASIHEKYPDSKKQKIPFKDSSNHIEKIKFPDKDTPPMKKNENKVLSLKKRRMSFSESKHESSVSREPSLSNQIKERRMSCSGSKQEFSVSREVTMMNKIKERRKSVCVSAIEKKQPKRRQTFCEIDMFSIASQMRVQKYGVEKPKSVNNGKDLVKPTQTLKKQNSLTEKICEPKKVVSNEKPIQSDHKKTESKKSTTEPEQPEPDVSITDSKKFEEMKQKASLCKIKITTKNRGYHLIQDTPNKVPATPRRNSCFVDQQSSVSKETLTVSAFREKYIKPSDTPASRSNNNNNDNDDSGQSSTCDKIPEEDSLSARINLQMRKQHEELAVESANKPENETFSSDENSMDSNEYDDDDEQLGFYTTICETPPQEKEDMENSESPMKDDPRGKTKWVTKEAEIQENSEKVELEPFPETPYLNSNIIVQHDIAPKAIKSILKSPFYKSSNNNINKRVSFSYKLCSVRYIRDDSACSSYNINQQIAHVPPMRQSTKNPKDFEIAVCEEILEWDPKWLDFVNEFPENWKLEPLKHTYDSLNEYKSVLKTYMKADLLRKLATKNKSANLKKKPWNFVTVKERKDECNHHMTFILGNDSKDIKQGSMILLKVREKIDNKAVDITFFGYVTVVNDRGELKLTTYCKELRKEKAVLKALPLTFIRHDLKLFAVHSCLEETPLIKLFLNPSLNKMEHQEGTPSIGLNLETSLKLNTEQRKAVKKLLHECTIDDSERIFFINGAAGTGKTYMMIATIFNLKFVLKEKRRFLICTSTVTGIDIITETINDLPYSSSLNIVRVGFRDKISHSGRKLFIGDQVQQRINRGAKGTFREIYREIIEGADVILATCRGCYDLFDHDIICDICFIDEANYCLDSELLIPMKLNVKKLILVGDEFQLEPTQSPIFKEMKSNVSYFKRIIDYYRSVKFLNAPIFTLTTQHRMNRDLYDVCNKYVYENTLRPFYSTIHPSNYPFKSFVVFDLNVPTNDNKSWGKDPLTYLAAKLCELLPKSVSIGILIGFQSQKFSVQKNFDKKDSRVEFISVEEAQGVQKDVLILMLRKTELNFMHIFNRINVALTRARKALYVCWNVDIKTSEVAIFKEIKEDAKDHGLYHVIKNFDKEKLFNILTKCN